MARKFRSRSGSIGHLSYQPGPDEGPVSKTLEFIRQQLPAWRDDPERPRDSSEKRLNSSLCDFLDSRSRSEFPMVRFKHESLQTEARTVDMGVHGLEEITLIGTCSYTIYEPFMVIECKRLPAPSKDREREYVAGADKVSGGPTGGIQRFKLGLHGREVETAVIVGYIEKETADYWFGTINQWITALVGKTNADGCDWKQEETLQHLIINNEQDISTAMSVHQRCVGPNPSIKLHHLWVIMRLKDTERELSG
jgi:hypothetical protein